MSNMNSYKFIFPDNNLLFSDVDSSHRSKHETRGQRVRIRFPCGVSPPRRGGGPPTPPLISSPAASSTPARRVSSEEWIPSESLTFSVTPFGFRDGIVDETTIFSDYYFFSRCGSIPHSCSGVSAPEATQEWMRGWNTRNPQGNP